MNKLVFAAALGVVSLFSLGGCKQIAEAKKAAEALKAAASAVADKGTAVSSEEDKDAQLGSKLGEYISCMNGTSKRVIDSRNRYLSWIVDEKVGPTGKERNIYGLYDINADTCFPNLERAKTAPPAIPEVESAAAEYRKALEELDPLVKQANKYYDQNDYKDDKMAKGKQLHPQLMNAFAKFEQVSKGFEDRVTALNDAVNARQFARLEKDPSRRLQYLSQKSLNEAKALIKLTDIAELKELDLQKYDVALQTYDKALTELEQYADSHKAETSRAMMFSSYLSSSKNFLKSAKELLRRKRDNKD
ncbi:MAG: YiiG family protein, partial [Myxococcales bacterium]